MLEGAQRTALLARLSRVEGQIRGVRRMIQEPRPCIEILQQLSAAEAALARVSRGVFRYHVTHCVPEALGKGEAERDRVLAELADIVDRFAKG